MQEVEIPPRDCFKYYVTVTNPPATLLWNFATKKNNIGFGLFFQRSTDDSASSPQSARSSQYLPSSHSPAAAKPTSTLSPEPELPASVSLHSGDTDSVRTKRRGRSKSDPPAVLLREPLLDPIVPIKRVNSAKATIKDQQTVSRPGTYVLYFDNTFSRNTSKKVTFFVALRDGDAPKDEHPTELQGWLLKKKRKRMQGWAKRYFTCDRGQVAYSKVPNGFCRGSVPLALSTISVHPDRRIINIDSGSSLWHLRALTQEDYDMWIAIIKRYKSGRGTSFIDMPRADPIPDHLRPNLSRASSLHIVTSPHASSKVTHAHPMESAVHAFIASIGTQAANIARLVAMASPPVSEELVESVNEFSQVLGTEKSKLMDQLSVELAKSRSLAHAYYHLRQQVDREDDAESIVSESASTFTISPAGRPGQLLSEPSRTPVPKKSTLAPHVRKESYASTLMSDQWYDAEDFVLSVVPDEDSDDDECSEKGPSYPEMVVEERSVDETDHSDDLENEEDDDDESAYLVDNYAISVGAMVSSPSSNQKLEALLRRRSSLSGSRTLLDLGVERKSVHVQRRSLLPSPVVGDDISIIGILRKNVGRDLSTVTMPISLNEPISLLQKLAEDLEYSSLLDRGAASTDSIYQMYLVAAFAVSSYASMLHRNGRKPFNPLHGETYELVRPDLGFQFVSEKVSHRPPVMACHATSLPVGKWVFTQHANFKSKFWGKSMELIPVGAVNVEFPQTGDRYSWSKITTCVRNIISGTKTLDLYGKMVITNHRTNERIELTFKENGGGGWLGGGKASSANEVTGVAYNGSGEQEGTFRGKWSEMCTMERGSDGGQVIWRASAPLPNCEQYYGFTHFTIGLNEITDDIRDKLPSTDSRYRPDQQLFENGNLPEAEEEKTRLEEKQRVARTEAEANGVPWVPLWFESVPDPSTGAVADWRYTGKYWQARERRAWPKAPDLFS